MRISLFLLGLLCGCAPRVTYAPSAEAARPASRCFMTALPGPIEPAFVDTQAAVQDFERAAETPMALLYIEKTSGHPERDRCVRLAQQADGQWQVFRYGGPQVERFMRADTALARQVRAVPPGHYMPACLNFSTVDMTGVLLVKHHRTTTFSMAVDVGEWKQLGADEQRVLQPGFDIVQRLKRW